ADAVEAGAGDAPARRLLRSQAIPKIENWRRPKLTAATKRRSPAWGPRFSNGCRAPRRACPRQRRNSRLWRSCKGSVPNPSPDLRSKSTSLSLQASLARSPVTRQRLNRNHASAGGGAGFRRLPRQAFLAGLIALLVRT